MKLLKRVFVVSMFALGLTANGYCAKPVKVKVCQDAFVQGGETANEALGATTSDRLRVMKSSGSDKYSRTTFLEFDLKKIEEFEAVSLNLCVRVYESKDDPSAQFQLQVYGADNGKWSEMSLTYNNKPEKGELLATQVLKSTEDNEWVVVSLPVDKVKELMKNGRKGKVTLVLFNDDFNKTSVEVISKERKWSNGTPANRDAFLEFR